MEEEHTISYAIIERTFDKAGDAKAQWLMIRAISEPAPPKDWRPYCFSESPIGVCGGAIDTDSLGYLGNRCKVCPYRKLE